MFGIPWVLLLVDRSARSTVLMILYHILLTLASAPVLPLPFDRLTQRLDDFGGERNPTWPQRGGANTLQNPRFAPAGDRGDIHIAVSKAAVFSPNRGRKKITSSGDGKRLAFPYDEAQGQVHVGQPSCLSADVP